ncbi:hypothetical protein DL93DRAFT_1857475 [Clavulina sp. PMI_390]|nr:hypothetical protein DL93DRAFT_1857475 [Clavulina sp. PMI_390]
MFTSKLRDVHLELTAELSELCRSFYLEPLLAILARDTEGEVEPDPLETIAVNIVEIILCLLEALSFIEPALFQTNTEGESASKDSSSPQEPTPGPTSRVPQFWPSKISIPAVKSTDLLPAAEAKRSVVHSAAAMCTCLSVVSSVVYAHKTIGENTKVKHQRPPLFWVLFSCRR